MSSIQSDVYVTVTGPALSRLLFENANQSGNQVGFLGGSVLRQLTDTISDTEISHEKIETSINIDSIVPISSFYNNIGRIDKNKIVECLTSSGHHYDPKDHLRSGFVGWYCFNRGSSVHHFSMREYIIHLQLSEIAQNLAMDSDPEHFVFCLLSSSVNKTTHAFKHSFLRFTQQKSLEIVPMKIHNLGTSQQLQYQVRACPPKSAVVQRKLMEQVGNTSTGKGALLEAQKLVQEELNCKTAELCEKEVKITNLRREVDDLRQLLLKKSTERDMKKQVDLSNIDSRVFVGKTNSNMIQHSNSEAPRSPDEDNSESSGARNVTSPVFPKRNIGRGRGQASRAAMMQDSD